MAISNTVTQFRQDVLSQGGPQIASLYRVSMYHGGGSLVAYPTSIVLPGRSFSFYEHGLWGPNRRVPYLRLYTTCSMTFNIYQDWSEKKFIESWMNRVVNNVSGSSSTRQFEKAIPPTFGAGDIEGTGDAEVDESFLSEVIDDGTEFLAGIGSNREKSANFGSGVYSDYVNYSANGLIGIEFLNTNKSRVNHRMSLYEAFPATISQIAVGADASGYPTFTVGFQFLEYTVG